MVGGRYAMMFPDLWQQGAARGIGMTSERTRVRLVDRLRQSGITDERVLCAIQGVPRHLFMDEALAHRAYEDTALPIGSGQTISQPYIVARMTQELLRGDPQRVLEVGTGCGYQTAILSTLVARIWSIERIDALHKRARRTLEQLEIRNVNLLLGDGYQGWPSQAPFDAIMVTAAPPELPEQLLGQLVDGGRLVIPVGGGRGQRLQVITRQGGDFIQEDLESVVFVPMLKGIN